MKNNTLGKIIFAALVAFCAFASLVTAEENSAAALGRENPFAEILQIQKPQPGKISRPQPALGSAVLAETLEPTQLFVQTVNLKFLEAKNLRQALVNMSSEYGSIATNPESNSLIICDTKEQLKNILAEIKNADKTPPQILIEVVILDVKLNDDTEIGVNWDILSDKNYNIGFRQNYTSRLGSTIESAATIGSATAFNTTGTGSDFSVISGTIRNVVHFLEEKTDIEILASPRIMVVSGHDAFIEAVEEIPFNEIIDTSEGGQLSGTEFKDVGIKLLVKATVADSDLIHLDINSEQKIKTGESDTGVPIVDARKIESSLLLRDGQVVIMGGLRRKGYKKIKSQLPLLGDLPLIGFLFKSTDTIVENSELMIMLSPHIYKDQPIPDEAMEKFNELRDQPILSVPDLIAESDRKDR